MSRSPKQIAEDLFDNSIQLNKIIWLSGCPDGDALSDDLREFLEDEDVEDIDRVLGIKTGLPTYPKRDDLEELLSRLFRNKKYGFIIQARTPVPTEFFKGGCSYSWGHTTSEWFYSEALDDALIQRLLKWRQEFVAKLRAKKEAK